MAEWEQVVRMSLGVVSPAGGTPPHPLEATLLAQEPPELPLILAVSALQKYFSLCAPGSAWLRLPGTVDIMEGQVAYSNIVDVLSEFQGSQQGGEEDAPVTEEDLNRKVHTSWHLTDKFKNRQISQADIVQALWQTP